MGNILQALTTSDADWLSTPYVRRNLVAFNNFLKVVHGTRDLSLLRSQCDLSVRDMAGSTICYYKRKALESCEALMHCIAPGQSNARLALIKSDNTLSIPSSKDSELTNRLVMLYEESDSWSTKKEILSLFAQDYTNSQLITMVPGLSKWHIDDVCKTHCSCWARKTT